MRTASELGANWIGGEWRAARGEHEFAVRSRLDAAAPAQRFARSDARDAREAMASVVGGLERWRDTPRARRARIVADAIGELERDPGLCDLARHAFALSADEARAMLDDEFFRARQSFELAVDGGEVRSDPSLFAAHWTDRIGPLAARSGARLLAGSTVVLLSDPRFPQACDRWARALFAAGLQADALALLHDDGSDAGRALAADPTLRWVRAIGNDERSARWLSGLPGSVDRWLGTVRAGTAIVRREDDVELAAPDLVMRALGRSATLSGQLSDQVGRVLCHQRVFSSFSEQLVAALDAAPDVLRPVPLVEDETLRHLREAWALGLDEGATPLHGGEPFVLDGEGVMGGDSGGVARTPRDCVRARPVVFTNVEPTMRLARLVRAMPVLRLLRVESDERASELAHGAFG